MIPNPCYIIEEKQLRHNLQRIADVAQAAGVEFILAFKAFALWKCFPIFRQYIRHTTASSPHEARLALEEFGSPAHTYSPAYEEETFPEILRCSSHITFNSLTQWERFAPAVLRHNAQNPCLRVSIGLRLNPEHSQIETALYDPCAPGSRFGVTADQLPSQLPDGIEGLHIHCHCESPAEHTAQTIRIVEERFAPWLPQAKWLNLGGGHLLTRQGYNTPLLIDALTQLRNRHPHLRVILEPGSAFAWQTGHLLAKVVDITQNHGIRTAILNVSFTCHMPDCLEMPYMPQVRGARIITDNNPNDLPNVYRLGGNSCLSGDFMGNWQFNHPLTIGEDIIFEDMIHYTTVKTTLFNGIQHPAIGIMHSDGQFELYRQFSYDDYRNRMC